MKLAERQPGLLASTGSNAGGGRLGWVRIAARVGGTAIPSCLVATLLLVAGGCGKKPASAEPQGDTRQAATQPGVFVDATKRCGIDFVHQIADSKMDNIMESDGAGGTLLDFDNDGYLDVYLVNSGPAPVISDAPPGTPRSPNRLYRNRADGTFEDVTQRAGVEGHGFGTTAAAADYDNDGFTDLLVVNFDGLILYHNRGDGTFEDVTVKAGLVSKEAGISATFFDADQDGFLDVFVANYLIFDPSIKVPAGSQTPYPGPLSYKSQFNILYRNRGDGAFEDVSETAGIRIPNHRAMSAAAFDYDLDGDQDVYVSNDGTGNLLLANDGKGHFKEVGLQSGVALNQFGAADGSMGAAMGDCDGDGLPDMFVTRFGKPSLYINGRGGFFEDRVQASGVLEICSRYTGWGGSFLDFDNDGDLDLIVVNGHAHFMQAMPALLLENGGQGRYVDASAKGGPFFRTQVNGRGCLTGDLNNDGRVDVVLTALGGPAVVLLNQCQGANHWLCVKLVGSRCNRDGHGAKVRVLAGGRTFCAETRCPTGYVSQHDARLHFGLGASISAERVDIQWPGGATQTLNNVSADRVLTVVEPGDSRWARKP